MRSLRCVFVLATLSVLASLPAGATRDCPTPWAPVFASCGDTVATDVNGPTGLGFKFTLDEAQELTFVGALSQPVQISQLYILADDDDCSVLLGPLVPNESGVLLCRVPWPAGSYVASAVAVGDRMEIAWLTMRCGADDCDEGDVAVERSSWSTIKRLFR